MMATCLQAFLNNLECRVCGGICRDPRNLTCSHTFCRVCLETLLASHLITDVLLCPTCRRGTWVPGGDVGGLQSNITAGPPTVFGSLRSDRLQLGQASGLWTSTSRQSGSGSLPFFGSVRSDGLQLGQSNGLWTSMSRQRGSELVLRALLPVGGTVNGMAISPNDHLAVCCGSGGILIYSSGGSRLGTALESVQVRDLHFMPDTGYVIRDSYNRISRYTDKSVRLDITFETKNVVNGTSAGLTVGKDGLIFVGYQVCKKIQVFKPEGGRAIREITCSGFPFTQIFAMTSSQAIVVKSNFEVHLINDVSGVIIHTTSISKDLDVSVPYPAVCQDNSVIIAWVKHGKGLMSIVQYKQEPNKCIKNILTDFNIKASYSECYLRAFKTGEIAFCTSDMLYIFHVTWE